MRWGEGGGEGWGGRGVCGMRWREEGVRDGVGRGEDSGGGEGEGCV